MCVGCTSNRNQKARRKEPECQYLFTELSNLDLKIIDMFKISKDNNFLPINKLLTGWIKNLTNECPPTDELNIVREYIENEYPKYFPE